MGQISLNDNNKKKKSSGRNKLSGLKKDRDLRSMFKPHPVTNVVEPDASDRGRKDLAGVY